MPITIEAGEDVGAGRRLRACRATRGAANDDLILPTLLDHPRPVAQRDLGTWPALHRRTVGCERDQIVADGGNLLDQVLAGCIIPAVNGVGVVGLDPGQGRAGAIFPAMPSRRSKKDSPAKLAGRMKRRWRVVLLRNKGEILGQVEASDVASAKAAAVVQFELDESSATGSWCRSLADPAIARSPSFATIQ